MGIFDGLFKEKEKAEDITPPVSKTAQAQLEEYIKRYPIGTDIGIPTRSIAGLSPLQRELIRLAGGQATGEDFGIARNVFSEAAQRGTDISQDPEYLGLRREIERLGTEQQTGIRQRGELAGQLKSTPTAAIEAESQANLGNFLMQEFARLQRQAEQDKLFAASGLMGLGTERLGQLGQAAQIADQERMIEQARNDAIYNQALKTVLLPYQEQLKLLSTAIGVQPQIMMTGGGLTDLGFLAQTIAPIGAAAATKPPTTTNIY